MPVLLPLLSASSEVRSEITAAKKPQRKLRRRNPPPSLSNTHQKLPSSAGSSVIGSRPTSSRSTRASIGGWFTGRRSSVDAGPRDSPANVILPTVHHDGFVAGVHTPPASESPTSLRQEHHAAGRNDDPYQRLPRGPYLNSSENQPALRRSTHPGELRAFRAAASNEKPRAATFSVNDEFLLPPTAPFSSKDRLSNNGSPLLPPLPSFQAGDFGFDPSDASSSQESFLRDNPDIRPPKNPARRKRDSGSSSFVASPNISAQSSPSRKSFSAEEYQAEIDGDVRPSISPVHALTTEEPVVLPAVELLAQPPTEIRNPDSPTLPRVVQEYQDDENKSSFLGGWKLAMKNFESKGDNNSAGVTGWIQRRRGSFSTPRPPSSSVAAHKSYAQEYKEFRSSQNSSTASPSSARSSTVDPVHSGRTDARIDVSRTPHIPQPIQPSTDPRKFFADSVQLIGELLDKKEPHGPMPPPSPPPSRNGSFAPLMNPSIAPLTIRKPSSSSSASSSSASSSSSPARGPAPPPGHKAHQKKKSISPLRNELSPSPTQDNMNSSKGKQRARSISSSSGTLHSSRPPTPPKPVAKLFVICCRCKYWHDLPSEMYKAMVETGGATRCPFCLHGMETSCCEGYTCVVYMHQRHH